MPKSKVETQHPDYKKMVDQWKKCRDTASGQKAMHDAGTTYLPKLTEQDADEYNAYKGRAQFFNATWRTIEALTGMLFRNPPEVVVPASVERLLEDVTMAGKNFTTFAKQVANEVETMVRVGILVDYPQGSTDGMSLAEAERSNLRPSMNYYITESIINWKTQRINNEIQLTMVVIKEDSDISENEFEHKTECQYRVLDLVKTDIGYVYRVRIFKVKDGEDEQIGDDLFPIVNGVNLDRIPFFFINPDDTTPAVKEPPLIDLMDCNIAHYKLDADLKHGLHFTGLPQPWVSGYNKDDNDSLCIGSTSAWVFSEVGAQAGYLEFTGQGLSAISTEKEKIENQMAILGARLLSSEKKATETAQTAQIHRAGEDSVLASIAVNMGIGLTQALTLFCEWAGSPSDEVSVTINNDFLPSDMDPQDLTAWVGAQQMGSISDEVFFWNLQKKEAVPPDLTFEDHQAQLNNKRI